MLIALSGLPGTGKTTVARELARELAAVYLRIDSIEQSIRAAVREVGGEGYGVAYAVAEDNLRLGRIVVADCVNPWPLLVITGELLQTEAACQYSTSRWNIPGHKLPTWQDVLKHDYREWNSERTVIDTARLNVEQSVRAILANLPANYARGANQLPMDSSS